MTKQEQKTYAIGGAVVIVILLLLFLTGRGRQIIAGNNPYQMPGVAAGSLGDIIIEGGGPIVIPGLDLGGRDLQMIGSCCMDCSAPRSTPSNVGPRTSFTFVTNQGARMGDTYNYSSGGSSGSGGFVGIPWAG